MSHARKNKGVEREMAKSMDFEGSESRLSNGKAWQPF